MKRRLLNLLTVLSLLLCVAVAASWSASYARTQHAVLYLAGSHVMAWADAGGGVVRVGWSSDSALQVERTAVQYHTRPGNSLIPIPPRSFWQARGFRRHADDGNRSLYFPHWLAMLAVSVPSACLLWRRRPRWGWRIRLGLCTCGYDLRATPGRCPECGTPAPPIHT